MNNQHPITPPPELVQQWINEEDGLTAGHIATQAARWGADQELNACCEWLHSQSLIGGAVELRAARRPKPPSLKEQALAIIEQNETKSWATSREDWVFIRRALEQLND
jgi:hypothetical protein